MIAEFFPQDKPLAFAKQEIETLEQRALNSDLKRARYCLHDSPSAEVHNMLIALHHSTQVHAHRHRTKSEIFHIIKGDIQIILWDNDCKQTIEMGPIESGKQFFIQIPQNVWHKVNVLSEFAIIHEVSKGPFIKEETETDESKQ